MEAFEQLVEQLAPNLYAYRDRFFTSFAATFEMFAKAGLIAFVVGLFFGVLLVITRKGGVRQNLIVYQIVNIVINVFRSIPFIILLIFLIPLTRAVVGTAIGVKGAILPLVFGTVPFYTRQVEVALTPIVTVEVVVCIDTHEVVEVYLVGSLILCVTEIKFIRHLVGEEQSLLACLFVAHGFCRNCHYKQ